MNRTSTKNFGQLFIMTLFALLLAACGGSSGGDFIEGGNGGGGTTPPTQTLGSVTITSDRTSMNANGSEDAVINVAARDTANGAMAGVVVALVSDSGDISPSSVTTDANGRATATLTTGGDTSSRTITVSGTSGGQSGTVSVDVIPDVALVTLVTDTPTIATDGSETATITAIAQGASNEVLEGVTIIFGASSGEISPASAVTDASGRATATLSTTTSSEIRTIEVSGTVSNGESGNVVVAVVPDPGSEIIIQSVQLLTDTTQIGSSGGQSAVLTAFVKDAANNFVEGVTVVFFADSGGIQVTQAVTNAAGRATALLNASGDQTNRVISVSAATGGQSDMITVDVIGTTLAITGPSNISSGDEAVYTAILNNSDNVGVSGETITITSQSGNTLSSASGVTDSTGRVEITLTGTAFGDDTITATGFGEVSTTQLSVSGDEFVFTAPAENTEIPLNTAQAVTTTLVRDGQPIVGETVTFSSTRGAFVGGVNTAVTDANGNATVSIIADNSGPVLVLATTSDGVITDYNLEFIATVPAFIEVQANPFTVPTNEQSSILAIVRDPNNNLVKNATVVFSVSDVSGGQLSSGTAITNSQGVAQIFFTAGDVPSPKDGVIITASVVGATGVSDVVALTVSGRSVFISMGTGNTVEVLNTSQYGLDYAIQVTDINGIGVANQTLTMQMLPDIVNGRGYYKGFWNLTAVPVLDDIEYFWVQIFTVGNTGDEIDLVNGIPVFTGLQVPCPNEDVNTNAILDPGEDLNGNGQLEPGNIATATPRIVTTDSNGFAFVRIVYPKEFAFWADVVLTAQTTVAGTEYTEVSRRLVGSSPFLYLKNSSIPTIPLLNALALILPIFSRKKVRMAFVSANQK